MSWISFAPAQFDETVLDRFADAFALNVSQLREDGDKDIKRLYCETKGIEYIVLKREPKPSLIRRTSTDLRGY